MTLDEFADIQRKKGLVAQADTQALLLGVRRAVDDGLPHERFARHVSIEEWEFDDETIFLEDHSYVEWLQGSWSFRNCVPTRFGGSNPDYVQYSVDDLQDLLIVVDNYYFRPPLEIQDWIIPVYQRPAWTEDAVRAAIRCARRMLYSEAMWAISDAKWDNNARYYECRCMSSQGWQLALRYDCGDAIIYSPPSKSAE